METKFESSIREIDYPQQAVYQRLSDLTLSEEVRDRLPEEHRDEIIFDGESITMSVPPVGSISIRICDREEPAAVSRLINSNT